MLYVSSVTEWMFFSKIIATFFWVVLTDAVVPQVAGQALPLVLRVVLSLPQLELLTGNVLVLRLPLERRHSGWAGALPQIFICAEGGRATPTHIPAEVRLTGFLHWAQKLLRQDGQVTFSWFPSLMKPEVHWGGGRGSEMFCLSSSFSLILLWVCVKTASCLLFHLVLATENFLEQVKISLWPIQNMLNKIFAQNDKFLVCSVLPILFLFRFKSK